MTPHQHGWLLLLGGGMISILLAYLGGLSNNLYSVGILAGGWITGMGAAVLIFTERKQGSENQ